MKNENVTNKKRRNVELIILLLIGFILTLIAIFEVVRLDKTRPAPIVVETTTTYEGKIISDVSGNSTKENAANCETSIPMGLYFKLNINKDNKEVSMVNLPGNVTSIMYVGYIGGKEVFRTGCIDPGLQSNVDLYSILDEGVYSMDIKATPYDMIDKSIAYVTWPFESRVTVVK